MVTIKDIANKAGVSSATVSMALNGKGNISEKTKRKLLRIAKEMNYIPSSSAKALKTHRSMTIGLVVGSLRNTYFTDIIASVEDVARRNGFDVFICDAERNLEKAGECLTALQSRGVDGIIFSLSLSITDEFSRKLQKMVDSGIKLVSLTRCVENIGIPIVSFFDEECLRTMIERLFCNGHEKILAIAAPEGSWLNKYRLKTYSDMMKARGLFNPNYITYASELSISGGKEAALALFRKHPEITAVVCINDVVAIGAMQAVKELGMSVPQDVSILGSDGNPFIQLTTPKISSVLTPRSEIGRFAAEKLVKMIKYDATDEKTSIFIPCSCFDGESIGPARTT